MLIIPEDILLDAHWGIVDCLIVTQCSHPSGKLPAHITLQSVQLLII